jgi:hypothetical protein
VTAPVARSDISSVQALDQKDSLDPR